MSQPTIRKQRIRRSSVKVRLIVFGTLAVLLILFSVFSEQLTTVSYTHLDVYKRQDCGMMFQQNALFPWLTVRENIEFGPKMLRKSQQDQARINELLQIMRLEDFSNVYPAKISGGMQQRAALARALAKDPSVLLRDEPLGALDAFTRMRLQDELIRIWQWQKNTMLMITHDIDEAVYLAQKVIILTQMCRRDSSSITRMSSNFQLSPLSAV